MGNFKHTDTSDEEYDLGRSFSKALEYGTPPTRLEVKGRAGSGLSLKSNKSMRSVKSKEAAHTQKQNSGKGNKKRGGKSRKGGGDAARRRKQDARLYKDLNTVFQVLGIDSILRKSQTTATPDIPFAAASSAFLSESDSDASSVVSASTSSVSGVTSRLSYRKSPKSIARIGGYDFAVQSSCASNDRARLHTTLEGVVEEPQMYELPERVRTAKKKAEAALQLFDCFGGEGEFCWDTETEHIKVIDTCLAMGQDVICEMEFSVPAPLSGSIGSQSSLMGECDSIISTLGGVLDRLYKEMRKQAVLCAKGMAVGFQKLDMSEGSIRQAFQCAEKLIRTCQQLLTSEERLCGRGVGQFRLLLSQESILALQSGLFDLFRSANAATQKFQQSILVEDNLKPSEVGQRMSVHELSEASRSLPYAWLGCKDLVTYFGKCYPRLKYVAQQRFAETLGKAAVLATNMQKSCQAGRQLMHESANVWIRRSQPLQPQIISDDDVQAHFWLLPCVVTLLQFANDLGRPLRAHVGCLNGNFDDGTAQVLDSLKAAFYDLIFANVRRMSWLSGSPNLARWALERLEEQGSSVLLCVKKYDAGALRLEDDYINTQAGMKKYNNLREATDQLTNDIFNLRTKLQVRQAQEPEAQPQPQPPTAHKRSVSGSSGSRGPGISSRAERVGNGVEVRSRALGVGMLEQALQGSGRGRHAPSSPLKVRQQNKGFGRGHVPRNAGRRPGMTSDWGCQNNSESGQELELGRAKSRELEMFNLELDEPVPAAQEVRDREMPAPVSPVPSPFLAVATQWRVKNEAPSMMETKQTAVPPSNPRKEEMATPFMNGPPGFGSKPMQTFMLPEGVIGLNDDMAAQEQTLKLGCKCAPDFLPGSWTAHANNSFTDGSRKADGQDKPLASNAPGTPSRPSKEGQVRRSYAEVLNSTNQAPSETSRSCGLDGRTTEKVNAEVTREMMERKMSGNLPGSGLAVVDGQLCNKKDEKEKDTGWGMKALSRFPRNFENIRKQELSIRCKLGEGSSGQVYGCDFLGGAVAVKILKRPNLLAAQEEFQWEVTMHKMLTHHPNIVRYFGQCKGFGTIGEEEGTGLVMEWCKYGSLLNLLDDARYIRDLSERNQLHPDFRLKPGHALFKNWYRRLCCGRDIACGMTFLHSRNILHRDLTSYNVVVNQSWEAKVCDFAKSRVMKDRYVDRSDTIANSPAWSAPEVIMGQRYGKRADVFSLGVILWELATLERPWEEQLSNAKHFHFDVMAMVEKGVTLILPEETVPALPEWAQLRDLIKDCWKMKESERPSMDQVYGRLCEIIKGVEDRAHKLKRGQMK